MKTTLELPDELISRLESAAVRENREVSEVAREALARGLSDAPMPAHTPPGAEQRRRAMAEWLGGWQELGAQIRAKSVDSSSMVDILRSDRESRR